MDIKKYLDLITVDYKPQFDLFKELLLNYNKKCNLTSITDEKGVLYKHFLDSVLSEELINERAKVIEIGSGGGFPSVPLMIIRGDLSFTLIESTNKKCTFLKEVVDKLSLNCGQVLNIRAEEGAHRENLREKYDFAVARAVAELNVLCEYCMPYVKVGGYFLAYKGDADEELARAANAVKILGGEVEKVVKYELPEDMGKRSIIVIKKIKSTPARYPRGCGKERKAPL